MQRLLGAVLCVSVMASSVALASSHREAPFITRNPKVDGTDFYLFNSYESGRANFVTVIANYQPLQDAYGGPNYFSMDPDALYEIHFDNTGDGVEDVTFQFRFQNTLLNGTGVAVPSQLLDGGTNPAGAVAIPLINAFPVGLADGGFSFTPSGFQGQRESYTVSVIRGARRSGTAQPVTNVNGGAMSFQKPLDNIGAKTFPANSYANYARAHVYDINIPGCSAGRMFVGQRAEGFAVNLGTIFDLVNAPATVITNPANRGVVPNTIANKNVTTLALEIPTSCLTNMIGGMPNTVVGGWTTASLRQARVINPTGTYQLPARQGGAWVQVSRLGMPLVNEVVIGVPDKDKFNGSEPRNDLANFAPYVLRPTLPQLLAILFGADGVVAPRGDRNDLVTAFLTGVPGVNAFPAAASAPPTEMVRLNTGIPATPVTGPQNNLGALGCFTGRSATTGPSLPTPLPTLAMGCDPAGFPNGRRPGDDVVDIALRVSMGLLMSNNDAPAGAIPFHDAVLQDASQFDAVFPYLKTPNPGS